MKFIARLLPFLLLAGCAFGQTVVGGGLAVSCNAVTTTGACTAFALAAPNGQLPGAFTWQTQTTGSPGSISVTFEGSIDGTNWTTIDTSTATAGEIRSVTGKPMRQLRCNVGTLSGGASPSVTCQFTVSTSSAGGSGSTGSVTNIATSAPITGGPITNTGTIGCPTCTTSAASLTSNALLKGQGGQAMAASAVATDDGTTLTYTGTGGVLSNNAGGLKAGANGGSAGVLHLLGSTTGDSTCTAPAVAGTVTNPVTCTNWLATPGLSFVNPVATAGTPTGVFNSASQNIVFLSNGVQWMFGNQNEVLTTKPFHQTGGNLLFVTANFTTAANTSLQTITGLAFTHTASNANNWNFHCALSYSQATANAAVTFGIQAATNSPTNIFATGTEQITVGPPATFVTGILPTLTTTTATNIVSGTPGATATNYTVTLDGTLELALSANTINFMVSTATSADAVTVLRGSYCNVF